MSGRYEDARRGLQDASQALSALRQESGAAGAPEGEAAAAAGLRAALDAARKALEEKARALESSEVRLRELERTVDELRRAATVPRPDPDASERVRRAESETVKARQAAAAEAASLNGRLSLQGAELVRLDTLRRKAEEAVKESELTRRQVEEALRREIRSAHAALDRAAAEAGAREARVQADVQGLQRRLDAMLTRTDQLSREQRVERERWRNERERLAATLQRASAVHASLRRELVELRGGKDSYTEDLVRKLQAAEAELKLRRPAEPAPAAPESKRRRASDASDSATASALIGRLKPAAAAAYERLRELSAVVPLSEAERASLRRAASALAGLTGAVGLLSRYLDDGPTGVAGPVFPQLERAHADWEQAFKRKNGKLALKIEKGLPPALFDASDLALALDQLLRRAFEVVPQRTKLELSATKTADGVEIRLDDDAPPLPARSEATAFEPAMEAASALSLSLPFARRAARRWGGEARLERSPAGGTRIVLLLKPA